MKISNTRKNKRLAVGLVKKDPSLCPHCQDAERPGNHWNSRYRFFECVLGHDITRFPWVRMSSI